MNGEERDLGVSSKTLVLIEYHNRKEKEKRKNEKRKKEEEKIVQNMVVWGEKNIIVFIKKMYANLYKNSKTLSFEEVLGWIKNEILLLKPL